ncbi:MAG: tripartite tricarboxylate transporter permease [Thermoplasmata archaeon]
MDPFAITLGVLFFALLGTAAGVVTGLTPGLHVNTVAALILAFQGSILALAGSLFAWAYPTPQDLALLAATLVVGNVVAHTFLDYVPSIFLGAPDAETALSVLPGHRMLLQGRGLEAIRLSAWGSLVAALLALLLVLPFRVVMGAPVDAYDDLRPVIPYLLILVAAILIVSDAGKPLSKGAELVCRVPEGIHGKDEVIPGIPILSPSETEGVEEAFLLRGRATRLSGNRIVVEDARGSTPVQLDGTFASSLDGEVTLFVAPIPRASPWAALAPKAWATLVFLLAGYLGFIVLLTPLLSANWFPLPGVQTQPNSAGFLPLFTGLFALPTLLISLAQTPDLPPQEVSTSQTPLRRRDQVRATLGGSLAGAFVAWVPGVTAATATIFSQLLAGHAERGRTNDEAFILSLSCVNTATGVFTILALFVILQARSGGAAAIQTLSGDLVVAWDPLLHFPQALAWFLLAVALVAVVAFLLTRGFGALFARLAGALPYRKIVVAVVVLLIGLILLFSGAMGLAIATVATLIGLFPPLVGLRRVHLMGSLIVPLVILLVT